MSEKEKPDEIRKPISNIRYFIIYFTGVDENKKLQKGQLHMFIQDNGYVNEENIHEVIEEDLHLTQPFIARILELPEKDFFDFVKKHEPSIDKKVEIDIKKNPKKDTDLDNFI